MQDYISEDIEEFGEDVSTLVSSSVVKWIFSICKSSPLTKEKQDIYLSMVAKL